MKVKVLLFAALREAFGTGELSLLLSDGANSAALLDALVELNPEIAELRPNLRIAINEEMVPNHQAPLKNDDEIAVFPPVGGG